MKQDLKLSSLASIRPASLHKKSSEDGLDDEDEVEEQPSHIIPPDVNKVEDFVKIEEEKEDVKEDVKE